MSLFINYSSNYTKNSPAYDHLHRMAFIGISEAEMANVLNTMGLLTPLGKQFTRENIRKALKAFGLDKPSIERLRTEVYFNYMQPSGRS